MAVVLGGNDFADYAAVTSLAERVRLEIDADADAAFPDRFLARVTVHHRDGRLLHRTAFASGSPEAPLGDEAVRAKFRSVTASVAGETRTSTVVAVDRLAAGAPAGDVLAFLR
jgi:2-methylcitrate dehydratase PrpD